MGNWEVLTNIIQQLCFSSNKPRVWASKGRMVLSALEYARVAKTKDADWKAKKEINQVQHHLLRVTHTCAEIVRWKVFAVEVSLDMLLCGAQ